MQSGRPTRSVTASLRWPRTGSCRRSISAGSSTRTVNPQQREYAETVRNSADNLLTIVNDILDFSKIEAGKLTFESVDFNLIDAVEGTLEMLAERAQRKGIELVCDLAPDLPLVVRGD